MHCCTKWNMLPLLEKMFYAEKDYYKKAKTKGKLLYFLLACIADPLIVLGKGSLHSRPSKGSMERLPNELATQANFLPVDII